MSAQTIRAWKERDFRLTDADFRLVSDIVYTHAGIALGKEKRDLVQARLSRQIRTSGFSSISDYVSHALSDTTGSSFAELIDAISTNLTSFFREPQHFEFLSQEFLPALIERKKKNRKQLIAWSAACSSGEEPYTLGITLLESLAKSEKCVSPAFRDQTTPGNWDARILATDISTRVLATARAARYSAHRVQTIPANVRNSYFGIRRDDGSIRRHQQQNEMTEAIYEASPLLRQIIRFRHLNLIDSWPFRGPFDFILCRNVMIYFDRPTQEKLVNRFWEVLAPGGLLITGHSESLSGIGHRFRQVRPTIYHKA